MSRINSSAASELSFFKVSGIPSELIIKCRCKETLAADGNNSGVSKYIFLAGGVGAGSNSLISETNFNSLRSGHGISSN